MDAALKIETERLARSWMQHDAAWLRDYLISGVEDPRINLQSIFARHFLLRALFAEQSHWLMEPEYDFSASMNWMLSLAERISEPQELQAVLHALNHGSDNVEGISIPGFVQRIYAALPSGKGEHPIPNYIARALNEAHFANERITLPESALNTFADLWKEALACNTRAIVSPSSRNYQNPSVLEPACGSANEYRFFRAYGLASVLDYTGLDICEKNIQNARALFPDTRFELGNVFELDAADGAFDLCFLHDLFEHLSPAGLESAVKELCRVTRRGMGVGCFNLDEIPEHIFRPVEDYHWNTLSLERMKELFAGHGFACRVVHIGTFLNQHVGCSETHNRNAYTLFLWRSINTDSAPTIQPRAPV